MRSFINIVEGAFDSNRFWFNPKTGESRAVPRTHAMAVWDDPADYGVDPLEAELMADYFAGDIEDPPTENVTSDDDESTVMIRLAIQNGWVRIAGIEPPYWPIPVVQAQTMADARKAARWMVDQGLVADALKVDVGVDDPKQFQTLKGRAIDQFLRGVRVNRA